GTYTRNQFAIAALLKAALEAEREIWVRARKDIEAIAHNTIAALDHLDSWSCTQGEWTMALTVFAAVLAIPTAGISEAVPAMGWAAVMSGAAVASTLPPPVPAPELVFQGSTVADVVAETRAAITRFAQAILDQERKIADAMAHDHALVEAGRWR